MLSGRGYAIAPAPVRLSGRTVLGLVLAVTVAATIPALWLSSRCFVGPAEPLPELSAQQQAAAQNLTALGMDESLVQALSPEELDRCAGAVSVKQAQRFQNGEDVPERQTLEDGTAGELSAYLVELSDGQLRWYYWFDLKEMPGRRIQEVFTVDPSGNYQATDYAARLLCALALWLFTKESFGVVGAALLAWAAGFGKRWLRNAVIALYVFLTERQHMPTLPWYRKLWFAVTFPLFDVIGRISTVIALFSHVDWKPIPHDCAAGIDEMQTAKTAIS